MLRLSQATLCICCAFVAVECWSDNRVRRFKDDFLFGAASSAYQVEGAWEEWGKGESIWDRMTHEHPEYVADGNNADVAADSYHQYARDVEMLRELGVDVYRFSISWPRILPTGRLNRINLEGVQYYSGLINELLKYNIEPIVTLYHWDLPQALQNDGGWVNEQIVTWFADYAKFVFKMFGNRVKYWITINEPNVICFDGYNGEKMAPRVDLKGTGDYECVKNVLLAHAQAWHVYDKEFRNEQKGKVGIALTLNWIDPINNKTENVKAAEDLRDFSFGLYLEPIYGKGDFPKTVKDIVAAKSKAQGLDKSRLPELTTEEIKTIKRTSDFLGVNHYTTYQAYRNDDEEEKYDVPSLEDDVNVETTFPDTWKESQAPWLRMVPYGLYKMMLHLNLKYDYPEMFITECGWASKRELYDDDRIEYYRTYLAALLLALEDGARVKGFVAWSLMDNFEWLDGYTKYFGLYQVDFDSPEKTRVARKSALVYKEIIASRIIDEDYSPKNLTITISNRRIEKIRNKDEL